MVDALKQVGMVGLGAMGRPIAEQIAKSGFPVVAFDLDPTIQAAGVSRVPDLAEVAKSDVVIIIVPTDEDVRGVVAGNDGLLAHGHPGMTVIVSASVHPTTCRELQAQAIRAGINLMDAALTGGVRRAKSGRINLLMGGDAAAADGIRDVLASFTKGFHVLGPVGAGQVGKSANNMIHWAEIVAINEAFLMAEKLGVDPLMLRAALQEGTTDSVTLRDMEKMRFTWYKKDLEISQQLAAEIDMELPVATMSRRLMDDVTVESVAELFPSSDGD